MPSPRALEEAVKSAVADASAGRRELGPVYAAEFRKDPNTFDPRKLMTLGREGLAGFVAAVGVPTVQIAPPTVERGVAAVVDGEHEGWEDQRRVRTPFQIFGVLLGTELGISLIIASAVALHFF